MNSETPARSGPASLIIRMKLRPGADGEFTSWHTRMATAPTGYPGFINADVTGPVDAGSSEWSIAQRFRDSDAMRAWRSSDEHRRLLAEAQALVEPGSNGQALQETVVGDGDHENVVTEVITTYVKPSRDHEYLEWARKVHLAEAQFPGYRGWFLQPPASDKQHYWTTLVRFATPEQLDAWLNSDARRNLLREHEKLVQSWEHHRLPSSFAGWFPPEPETGKSPPSWKQSLLVVLMLFPVVMLEMKFLSPLLAGMARSPATFIGNVISVFALSWPLMPMIIAVMSWWLLPRKDAPKWVNPAGVGLLFVFYTIEIILLAHL